MRPMWRTLESSESLGAKGSDACVSGELRAVRRAARAHRRTNPVVVGGSARSLVRDARGRVSASEVPYRFVRSRFSDERTYSAETSRYSFGSEERKPR